MTLGIGILGAANIANKNAWAIGLADGVEVVAVGARDASRAQALLDRWGIAGAAAYACYDDVIADPHVQAVYIPLPSALHLPWVLAAAAAGKHILLEKPVAANEAELDAMLEAVRAAGVQLMDGTMWMHNARTPKVAAALRESAGELRAVTSCFAFEGGDEFMKSNVRVKADLDPLGALGDLGWYCVRAILWAFSYEAPISVIAHAGAVFNESGVPLHIGATLLFPGGRRGNFECGFDQALTQSVEVCGTAGSVRLDDFVIPRSPERSGFSVTSQHGLSEWDLQETTRRDEVVVTTPKPQEVCMWEEFAALVRGIQQGGAPPDTHWPRVLELTQCVLFAVERSAREGCATVAFGG